MEELNGRWLMEKSLSSGMDAMLKLQGIGWTLRKGVSLATVRLDISVSPPTNPTAATEHQEPNRYLSHPVPTIDLAATLTGGIPGSREKLILDWQPRDHKDFLLGSCEHQSRFVYSVNDDDCYVYPDFEMHTIVQDERAKRYLRGEINENGSVAVWDLVKGKAEADAGSEEEGENNKKNRWVHTFMRNKDAGWTVEQIWAVEEREGKRYHTRRVVAANNGQYVLGKLVYSYLGE